MSDPDRRRNEKASLAHLRGQEFIWRGGFTHNQASIARDAALHACRDTKPVPTGRDLTAHCSSSIGSGMAHHTTIPLRAKRFRPQKFRCRDEPSIRRLQKIG